MARTQEDNGFMFWSQDGDRGEWIWLPPFVTKNWWLRLLSKEPVIGLEREIWLESCLIPVLKPGQVVVMDNATFHKGGRIEQLIQEAGCELLYLPAYSPDFNKIEQCWSWLKSRIRKQLDQFECLRDAMEYVLHLAS